MDSKTLQDIERDGWLYGCDYWPRRCNKFPAGSDEWKAWEHGYNRAAKEVIEGCDSEWQDQQG